MSENKLCSRCRNQAITKCEHCKIDLCEDHIWELSILDHDEYHKKLRDYYSIKLNLCENCARERLDEEYFQYRIINGKRLSEYHNFPTIKITIFGATGETEEQVAKQALAAGYYRVILYIPDKSKLKMSHYNLKVVQGELSDYTLIEQTVKDSKAVISTLSSSTDFNDVPLSKGIVNIVEAMKKQGVLRLILTSPLSVADPEDRPSLGEKIGFALNKYSNRAAYDEVESAVKAIRESELDWTIVRRGELNDGQISGKIKTGYLGMKEVGKKISFGDTAVFLLQQIQDTKFLKKAPVISD